MDRVPLSPHRDDPKKRRVEGPTSSQTRGTQQRAASVTGKPAPRKKDLFKTPLPKKGQCETYGCETELIERGGTLVNDSPGRASGVLVGGEEAPGSDIAAAVVAASNIVADASGGADVADIAVAPTPKRAPPRVRLLVGSPPASGQSTPSSKAVPPTRIPAPSLGIVPRTHPTPTLHSVLAAHAATSARELTPSQPRDIREPAAESAFSGISTVEARSLAVRQRAQSGAALSSQASGVPARDAGVSTQGHARGGTQLVPPLSRYRGASSQPDRSPALGMGRAPTPLRGMPYGTSAGAVRAASREASLAPMTEDRRGSVVKHLQDRIAQLEFDVSRLKDVVDEVPSVLVESMSRDIKILRGDVAKANARSDELEGKLESVRQEVTDWMAEMDAFKAEMQKGSDRRDVGEGGGVRNTILSMTIRSMCYDWMEIARDSTVLPDPLPINEKGEREYWTKIMSARGELIKVLRPGWTDPWSANESGWGRAVADAIKIDGARWNRNATQEELRDVPMPTLLNAMHVTFSSWVKAYKRSKRPEVDQLIVRQKQRRNTRKLKKATARNKYRADVPDAAGPEWGFIGETMYQSTDESEEEMLTGEGGEPAVDPDTDDEGPISRNVPTGRLKRPRRKPASQRTYVSCPPSYRAREVNDLLDEIDQLVADSTSTHTRVRGPPREKDIPMNKKKGKPRFPRAMIDPYWLASHPENDTPLRIQEVGQELRGEVEGDSEGVEGMYAEPGEFHTADPWEEAERFSEFEGDSPEGEM